MSGDELKAIRWELDQLLKKAATLNDRLEQLEGVRETLPGPEISTDPLMAEEPAPAALPLLPPPLPAHVLAQAARVETTATTVVPVAPKPVLPPAPPKPNPLVVALKKLGPKEEMSWEMALGTWWIPRIGALLLVLGVVGLLAWAVDEFGGAWWAPYFRLCLGYGICAALLITGKRLESRFTNFARVLLSGGIALSYFVTFATHYVPFTRVISRPEPTLLLLAVVVAAWTAFAQLRRSPLIACAVTLLGQLTVAVSTLTLDTPSRFAVVGLIALSVVSAFFLAKNRWYWVAATGMVGSYLNHFLWLVRAPASTAPLDCFVALGVLVLYFAIFAGAEILAPEELRRREVSLRLRSCYASFNTGATLLLGREIMRGFEFSAPYTHVFYFALAAALGGLGFGYWLRRSNDPLHNLYFTKATAIATLGFAVWLDGETLTATLAVEAVVLLMGARRSGLLVTRLLAHGAAALAFGHGLFVLANTDWTVIGYASPEFPGMAAAAVVTVLAFLAASVVYQKTDWTLRSPRREFKDQELSGWLWQFDALAEPPDPAMKKWFSGLLFPYCYAFAAAIQGVLLAAALLEFQHQAPAMALLGVALLLAATPLRSRSLADVSTIWGIVATIFWAFAAASIRLKHPMIESLGKGCSNPLQIEHITCAALTLAALLVLSEWERGLAGAGHGAWRSGAKKPLLRLPILHALAAMCAFTASVLALAQAAHWAIVFASGAALATLYATMVPAPGIALLALLSSAATAVFPRAYMGDGIPHVWAFPALALLAVPALLGERRYFSGRPGLLPLQTAISAYILYGAIALVFQVHVFAHFHDHLHDALLVLLAAAIFAASSARLSASATAVWSIFLLYAGFWTWAFRMYKGIDFEFYLVPLCAVPLGFGMDLWFRRVDLKALRVERALALVGVWGFLFHGLQVFFYENWGTPWVYVAFALIPFVWLGWAACTRGVPALVLGMLAACVGTAALLIRAYGEGLPGTPLVAGFALAILFWVVLERLHQRGTELKLLPEVLRQQLIQIYLVALPCILLLVMFERMPTLGQFFLTISWTASAVAIFAFGRFTGERFYRYAALAVFSLAIGRVFLFDVRELPTPYRILAFIVLGIVLLGVAYAYLLERQRSAKAEKQEGPPSLPGTGEP